MPHQIEAKEREEAEEAEAARQEMESYAKLEMEDMGSFNKASQDLIAVGPDIPEHLKNLPEKFEEPPVKIQKTAEEIEKDKVFAKNKDPFANTHKENITKKILS